MELTSSRTQLDGKLTGMEVKFWLFKTVRNFMYSLTGLTFKEMFVQSWPLKMG